MLILALNKNLQFLSIPQNNNVKIFFWQKSKQFFSKEETALLTEAIRDAEVQTSGELRVFVESNCSYVNALDRAMEIFYNLKMEKTKLRNGVLVYLATKDHQVAVFGDEGIHQKVGEKFWNGEVKSMLQSFNNENFVEGLRKCIADIGTALHTHFPFNKEIDKNELPDEIVFGR
jgi:uncharacterized membrane protein